MGSRVRSVAGVAAAAGSRRVTVGRLFAYGTLRDDTVVQELLGHRLFGRPAVLRGYEIRFDPSIGYPVICPRVDATVPGKVLDGIDADILAVLDAYEGRHYRRIIVPVDTPDGRTLEAYVYVPVAPCGTPGPT